MKRAIFCALLIVPISAAAQAPGKQTLQAPGGRFVFGQVSDFRQDQFMLDTQTGRIWQIIEVKRQDGTSGGMVLDPVPYRDMQGNLIGVFPLQMPK